jgi:hypothetical protein
MPIPGIDDSVIRRPRPPTRDQTDDDQRSEDDPDPEMPTTVVDGHDSVPCPALAHRRAISGHNATQPDKIASRNVHFVPIAAGSICPTPRVTNGMPTASPINK